MKLFNQKFWVISFLILFGLFATLASKGAHAQLSYAIPQGNTQGYVGENTQIVVRATNTSTFPVSSGSVYFWLSSSWTVVNVSPPSGWSCFLQFEPQSCFMDGSTPIAVGQSVNFLVTLNATAAATRGPNPFSVTSNDGLPSVCAFNGASDIDCTQIILTAAYPNVAAIELCSQPGAFGVVWLGESRQQSLCVRNLSPTTVFLGSSAANDSAFQVTGCASIEQGATCDLAVRYTPNADVDSAAALQITVNFGSLESAPDLANYERGYNYSALLRGSGLQLRVQMPSQLDFPATRVGADSCGLPLDVGFSTRLPAPSTVDLSWSLNGPFGFQAGDSCERYASGSTQLSCSRVVQFHATTMGQFDGQAIVTSNIGAGRGQTALLAEAIKPPPTIAVGYIGNQIDIFDSQTGVWEKAVPAGGQGPLGVVINPGRQIAYIAHHLSDSFNVVDLTSGASSKEISLPAGGKPVGLAVNEVSSTAYVSLWETGQLVVLDLSVPQVVHVIDVGKNPSGILLQPERAIAYVALTSDRGVAVVDTNSGSVVKRIVLPFDPSTLIMDSQRALIYVADARGKAVRLIDMDDDSLRPEVIDVGQSPGGMALSADGNRLYVTSYGIDSVAMIDLKTLSVHHKPTVAKPTGIAVTGEADGLVFVSGYLSNEVAVHRADTLDIVSLSNVTEGPAGFGLLSGTTRFNPLACTVTGTGGALSQPATAKEKRQ